MRVLVIIPTTDGPTRIIQLRRLKQVPLSQVVLLGDYVPNAELSERYHALTDAAGPLGELLDFSGARHEICIDRAPEMGRSWELPVAIAHWAIDRGHILDAETPEAVIWATGVIVTGRQIGDENYHIPNKLKTSREALASLASLEAELYIILPDAAKSDQKILEDAFGTAHVSSATTLDVAFRWLDEVFATHGAKASDSANTQAATNVKPYRTLARRVRIRMGLALTLPVVAAIAVLAAMNFATPARNPASEEAASVAGTMSAPPGDEAEKPVSAELSVAAPSPTESALPKPTNSSRLVENPIADPEVTAPVETRVSELAATQAPLANSGTQLASPHIFLIEHRASEGTSCINVLLDPTAGRRVKLEPVSGEFPVSEISGLCAISFDLGDSPEGAKLLLPKNLLTWIIPSDRVQSINHATSSGQKLRFISDVAVPVSYSISLTFGATDNIFEYRHQLVQKAGD